MIIEIASLLPVGVWLGNKILDKGFEEFYQKVSTPDFDENFYLAVNKSASRLQIKYPEAFGGKIEYLFKHEEVLNELMKLLFTHSKINQNIIKDKFDTSTLPKGFLQEFIEILKIELQKDELFNSILSNKEIYLTVVGLDQSLKEIENNSSLSLKDIQRIKTLLEAKFKNNFSISSFIEAYSSCIINNYSQLNFIGLGLDLSIKKGKRKNLEDLFVKPNFNIDEGDKKDLLKKNPEFDDYVDFNLENIFDFNQSLVILGSPGSGKSILTKYITLKLIKNEKKEFANKEILNRIPFRLELRKYHNSKKENKEGLSKYLRSMLELEFGFSNIPADEFEKFLKEYECLIIFDGLDEIFDIRDKLNIKNDIENFITLYPNSRIIVTSRFIGYNDAALNDDLVLKLTINQFDNFQIEKYIRNWYLIEESNENNREKEIEDLLEKRNLIDDELISNPLLLSLIVILYRNNLKVPESKLEIYQSCTKTLVDKWDFSKGLEISLSEEIYKRKDTIFADLAFWQYKELSTKNGKITYQRAKNTVAKSLNEKLKVADEFTSDDSAEKFLEYAEKRSLYFDNNFTHKTFLEYFTAFWIFTNIEKKHKKKGRDELIATYIMSPFWHIVLELLMNLIDKDQADNEIIDELIIYQLKKNKESSIFFLQVFSSLKNVSDYVYEKVAQLSIKKLIKNKEKFPNQPVSFNQRTSSPFLILSEHFKNNNKRESIENIVMDMLKENAVSKNDLLSFYFEIFNEAFDLKKDRKKDIENNIVRLFPENAIQEDELNYIMNALIINPHSYNINTTKYASEFIKFFGNANFHKQISAKYGNFTYFPFSFISLREILLFGHSENLNKFLEICESYSNNFLDFRKEMFKFPVVSEDPDKYINMVQNFNSINNKKYLELLVPIFYVLRFRNPYFHRDEEELKLSDLAEKINDKKIKNHVSEILKKEFRRTTATDYIIAHFNITIDEINKR